MRLIDIMYRLFCRVRLPPTVPLTGAHNAVLVNQNHHATIYLSCADGRVRLPPMVPLVGRV